MHVWIIMETKTKKKIHEFIHHIQSNPLASAMTQSVSSFSSRSFRSSIVRDSFGIKCLDRTNVVWRYIVNCEAHKCLQAIEMATTTINKPPSHTVMHEGDLCVHVCVCVVISLFIAFLPNLVCACVCVWNHQLNV